MFELYDLTDFGRITITENTTMSTSQILHFLDYIMGRDQTYTGGMPSKFKMGVRAGEKNPILGIRDWKDLREEQKDKIWQYLRYTSRFDPNG